MDTGSLAEALEREHRDIDQTIAAFTAAPPSADPDRPALTRAIHSLRRHIYAEEHFLFPALHRAGLVAPVFVMLREHAQIWATLDTLERELHAGGDTATARNLGHQLTVQLQHHNLKEERILYPQADTVLPPAAARDLRALLDSGDLPAQWLPLKVRR